MKKNQHLSVLFILLTTVVLGQNDCSTAKSENEKLSKELANKDIAIKTQAGNIQKLKKEINYYKQTLSLLNSKPVVELNNIVYHIDSVIGKTDEGKIIVKGVIENKGMYLKNHFNSTIELVDPKGNKYRIKSSRFGGQRYLTDFQRGVPVNFEMVFPNILEETPIMKALSWKINGKNAGIVLFKNLNVIWE